MSSDYQTLSLRVKDIPKLFNHLSPNTLCIRDVVAYVRQRVKDPWTPVVLQTKDSPIYVKDLKESAIFWESEDGDSQIEGPNALGEFAYCVMQAGDLNSKLEDFGFEEFITKFREKYEVQSVEVLVIGNERDESQAELLLRFREYVNVAGIENVVFPNFIQRRNRLQSNGFDLAVYVERIESQIRLNSLTFAKVKAVLDDIDKEIKSGNTVVQILREERGRIVSILHTYILWKYNLSTNYIPSFISEHLQCKYFHDMNRLSLYERIRFLQRLPVAVGYIGDIQSYFCMCRVSEKIYCNPHYVFDLGNTTVVTDKNILDKLNFGNPEVEIADFRGMFKGSADPFANAQFTNTSQGLAVYNSDYQTDVDLAATFSELEKLVVEEPVYITIKNSVIARYQGNMYLLYCPEECGLHLVTASPYVGAYEFFLDEEEFYRLMDAQVVMAFRQREQYSNFADGNKALAVVWDRFDKRVAMQPAIPLEITLYRLLLPVNGNGLSYYDKFLRCSKDVFPIINSKDFENSGPSELLQHVSGWKLRQAHNGMIPVNSFGTIADYNELHPKLKITFDVFD